ncbi:thioredoxin family protein [Halomonas sp. WWR20]
MNSQVNELEGEDFDAEVLASEGPVLVAFMAAWCMPCRELEPGLERLAAARPEVRVFRLDIERAEEVAVKYAIRGFPTLVLFMDGDFEATRVGALTDDQIKTFLDNHLS